MITHQSTHGIYVAAEPCYVEEKSFPEKSIYVFSYKIVIRNDAQKVVQLKKRAWIITDAFFNKEYIEGDGVVGEYPVIHPGESYSYMSFCQLKTNFGSMSGHYIMVDEAGNNMKINIPEFILAHPHAIQ